MRPLFSIILFTLVLSACSNGVSHSNDHLSNPLVAARYGEELSDTMANLVIIDDPIAKDPIFREIVDQKIAEGKAITQAARERMEQGTFGFFSLVEEDTNGFALLLKNTLYLSSDFVTKPGANVHLYLSATVDPRESVFPDATAIDLGVLQSPYGAQEYAVPKDVDEPLRTVVIWDTDLKRIHGFAQLQEGA